jgi:hypothetical protein
MEQTVRPVVIPRSIKERALMSMNAWFDALRFGADIQRVIALRMIKLAAGGPDASKEARLMVAEKVATFGEAQGAAFVALATGASPATAAKRAHRRYRRAVRANKRRLGS